MSIRNDLEDAFNEGYAKGLKEGRRFAVPVVRCKDCRFYNTHDHRCVRTNHGFKDDFYCAWGERREDGKAD